MPAPVSRRILRGGLILFTAYWVAFLFLDYWTHHPDVRQAIELFRFGGPAFVVAVLGGLIAVALVRLRSIRRWFNGAFLVVAFFIVTLILLNAFFHVSFGDRLDTAEMLTFIWSMLGTCLPVYLVLMLCFVLGAAVMRHTTIRLPASDMVLIRVGAGIMVVVAALFVLGALGFLQPALLYLLLGVALVLGWRDVLSFLRTTLVAPIRVTREMNAVGYASFIVLFVLVAINLVHVVRPIPLGYDAITLYVNLASLISEYNGLVAGHQPYNWSLFISLGYLLFNKTAVVLTLSFTGTVLSLFAVYRLSRKWLNVNFALLVVLLFYTMPMVNWLSFRDVKIDLGLLFFLLVILLLFYHFLAPAEDVLPRKRKKNKRKKKKRSQPLAQWPPIERAAQSWRSTLGKVVPDMIRGHQLTVLIGVFMGFAMGIKLSALLLFLAMIVALWYFRDGDLAALLGGAAIAISVVLLAGLDRQASLRQFHTSANLTAGVLFIFGTAMFVYLLRQRRAMMLANLRTTVLISCVMAVTLSPWLVKNYSETRSLSVTALTNGKRANPSPTLEEMDRIWRAQQQDQ